MFNKQNLEFERQSIPMDYAKLSSMILKDLNDRQSTMTTRYNKDDVTRFMENPTRYSKELQKLSQQLYNSSPHYKRIVNYFAHMATLDYFVEPYGIDPEKVNLNTFKKNYQKTLNLLDTMNIKHEVQKMFVTAWVNDAFYGYEHATKDSYFVQKLPNEYCQISSIEDGVYNVSFNFQYFDRNDKQLEFYPKEFKSLYRKYQSGSAGQWQELDSQKSVVIKVNEHLQYDMPPFANVFPSIFDIENYKSLKMTAETLENYKFLVQKIPLRDKSDKNNDFLIDLGNVTMFHNKTSMTLPEEIGLITSPMDIDTVDFTKDKSEKNKVAEAERDFYTSTGTSQLLFSGDGSSKANLNLSVNTDESEVFALLRQVERWLNRKIKNEVKGKDKFRVKILDLTNFNRDEYIDRFLKTSQFGAPVKMMLCASLGLEPSSVISMSFLENEVLGLSDMFVPLSSAHTQSGDSDSTDEGGRPQSDEKDLEQKGEEQRDRDDNNNR